MNIQFESVHFSYPGGVKALVDTSLDIHPADRIALVGENGAGKSTLAKHMNGLLKPDQGRVLLGGEDTRQNTVAQLSHHVGYVFQNPDEQIFNHTVYDEVAFGPINLGLTGKELEHQVIQALSSVGLAEQSSRHPYDLLPAERKLLGIASIVAMDTPVIILDEPTMGLDLHGVQLVSGVLSECFSASKTVIIISHDLDFCVEHVERYFIMAKGKIQLDTDIGTAFADPELLDLAGLEAPQLVRLAQTLGMQSTPGTVNEFLDLFERKIKPEG
jgi:energy-coupling factor transport system ATP-binding protein